jgi:hypothetical protein
MGEMRIVIRQDSCCASAYEFTCSLLDISRPGGEFPLVLQGCGGRRNGIRVDLDGREEPIRYITETGLGLGIGIVGQYLECFDSKSCFKLLHYICVSKTPNFWENKWWMR